MGGIVLNGDFLERFGTLTHWDDVSTGNNGATSLKMSRAMRSDHLYLIFVRRLNSSTETYPPYAYLLSMRSNAWAHIIIGAESEVVKKAIINDGKLTLTFKGIQWTRMVVYEVM